MELIVAAAASFLFLAFVYTLLKLRTSNHIPSTHHLNLIPGPKSLPLIGNLHLLTGKSPPHHVFRDLAVKHGPLMRLQLGEVPILFVSSVEVANQVMKTHDVVFANRPPIKALAPFSYNDSGIGLSPHGEYWRRLRKICTLEVLSARRVKSFRSLREEENADVATWIASNEGSPVNLSERIFMSSFDVTTMASVGDELEEKETLTSAIKEIIKLAAGLGLPDLYPSNSFLHLLTKFNLNSRRVFRRIDTLLETIIKQHRVKSDAVERPEDLVDVLLRYQRDDAEVRLSTDNIKAVILDMFLAGGETSATVVEWTMSELVRNPSTLKKVQDEVRQILDERGYVDEEKFNELKYLKLVIKETLRLHPPLPLLVIRQNSEKCVINGYEIPAKTRVVINAWALGRDPKYWNDTEKFKPERFEEENSSIDFKGNDLEYIPFGAGRRMCPGMTFGLANVEFPLATLLYHFDWKMGNGKKNEELDMAEVFGASVKRKHELMLIPILKRPLKLPKNSNVRDKFRV